MVFGENNRKIIKTVDDELSNNPNTVFGTEFYNKVSKKILK
tara:strand:+ start:11795 stop:11917 length:123 start_codon:yes stop_codon:yes gene_type:complete